MAQRSEIMTVYVAGLIQGVALVTFPAASAVFTSPSDYGLSSTEYGGMFVPQAVTGHFSSLLGAGLTKSSRRQTHLSAGFVANLLAMTLLVVSRFVMREHSLAYGILLAATACMGIGFGFTVPALNTFAAAFFPTKSGPGRAGTERAVGFGNGAGAGFCRAVCGTGNLVGTCPCSSAF